MRKFFTRLFAVFMLISMSLLAMAQPELVKLADKPLIPADGACNVATDATFTLTFKQVVYPNNGGVIALNNSDGTQLIPIQFDLRDGLLGNPSVYDPDDSFQVMGDGSVADWKVTFDGKKVIIDWGTELMEGEHYYITVGSNAINNTGDRLVANSELFAGIIYPSDLPLQPCGNASGSMQTWDFTIGDFTGPETVYLIPEDEETDVDPAKPLKIAIDEPITWGWDRNGNKIIPVGDPKDYLPAGQIALYYSTNNLEGVYGGDVAAMYPDDVWFETDVDGNSVVAIEFDGMEANTDYYVRVLPGTFTDFICCDADDAVPNWYAGFNANGLDAMLNDNGEWNFTTKDTDAPEVLISMGMCTDLDFKKGKVKCTEDCSDKAKFYIYINETDLEEAVTLKSISDGIAKKYVSLNVTIDKVKVIYDAGLPGVTIIEITPKNELPSETEIQVQLNEGLWDASHNPVPPKAATFMTGDYTPPVFTKLETDNHDGTSFDIFAETDEPAVVYYIVVKTESTLMDDEDSPLYGQEFFLPTQQQVYDWALQLDGQVNPNFPAPGTHPYAGMETPWDYQYNDADPFWDKDNPDTDLNKDVDIWAGGVFTVPQAGIEVLERVEALPFSDGTYYQVYAYAYQNEKGCGTGNLDWLDTDPGDPNLNKIMWGTDLLNIDALTKDILHPELSFNADFADDDDEIDDLKVNGVQNATIPCELKVDRNGALYAIYNEPIRLANGDPITGDDIEDICVLEVTDAYGITGTTVWDIDPVASMYIADEYTLKIVPAEAFPSGAHVTLYMLRNRIEDDQQNPDFGNGGTERNEYNELHFCVEDYCPPTMEIYADTWVGSLPDGTPMVMTYDEEDSEPGDNNHMNVAFAPNYDVMDNAVITIVFNQHMYAPVDDESTPGVREEIEEAMGSDTWVGNYIKIREADKPTDAEAGLIIDDENFIYTVDLNEDGNTVITVTPDPEGDFMFGSELWYNVEVEIKLQNAERYTLAFDDWDYDCGPWQPNDRTFQALDTEAPTVMFFEEDGPPENDRPLGSCDDAPAPVDMDLGARIRVEITEFVQLGFDGLFRDLEAGAEAIHDANALRRYFELTWINTGEEVPFDVEDLTLDMDETGETATFYIDPYNHPGEDGPAESPNWMMGSCYKIRFIGNPNELDESDDWYGPDALADDRGNRVEHGEACFCTLDDPDNCTPEVTLGTEASGGDCGDGIITDEPFWVTLQFPSAMELNRHDAGGGLFWDSYKIVVVDDLDNPVLEKLVKDLNWSADKKTVTFYDENDQGALMDGETYRVAIHRSAFTTDVTNFCDWPTADIKDVDPVTGLYDTYEPLIVIAEFETTDVSGPILVSLSHDRTDGVGTEYDFMNDDLVLTWDTEEVTGVPGQLIKIYREGTNTLVASIDASNMVPDDYETIIPYELLVDKLVYDECYYVHFNPGLVEDECGNKSDDYFLGDTDEYERPPAENEGYWDFCTPPDPDPCTEDVYPAGDDLEPASSPYIEYDFGDDVVKLKRIVLEFTEEVSPVAGKVVSIIELSNTSAVYSVNTSDFVSNDGGETWYYALPDPLELDISMDLNYATAVNPGGFKAKSNGAPSCDIYEEFNYYDETPPEITWWPENIYDSKKSSKPYPIVEHVAVNAHLFASFSEEMIINGIYDPAAEPYDATDNLALTDVNAAYFFVLEKYVPTIQIESDKIAEWKKSDWEAITDWEEVDFILEFVGDDKTKVMFTPLDEDGPDYEGGTNNSPSMEDDVYYRLRVRQDVDIPLQPNLPGADLTDLFGNLVDDDTDYSYVIFHTEDITVPGVTATVKGLPDNNMFDLEVVLWRSTDEIGVTATNIHEIGTVYYAVVPKGKSAPSCADVLAGEWGNALAYGSLDTDLGKDDKDNEDDGVEAQYKAIFKDIEIPEDAHSENCDYLFDVYVYAVDDEIDAFDEDSEISKEWPFDQSDDRHIPGLRYMRIRDIRPAPNACGELDSKYIRIELCDDDDPYIISMYPEIGDTDVPVDAEIEILFNEPINPSQIGNQDQGEVGAAPWHNRIVLRDYENNLAVPVHVKLLSSTTGPAGVNDSLVITPIEVPRPGLSFDWDLDDQDLLSAAKDLAQQRRFYIEIERYAVSDAYTDTDDDCGSPCSDNGNFLAELIGKEWWFKTEDNVPPELICGEGSEDLTLQQIFDNKYGDWTEWMASGQLKVEGISPYGECVGAEPEISITVLDGSDFTTNPDLGAMGYVFIYQVMDCDESLDNLLPHERIPLASAEVEDVQGGKRFTWTPNNFLVSSYTYRVMIPEGAFVDSYGNESAEVCDDWCFTVTDYQQPLAAWKLYEDYSYLNVVYEDENYSGHGGDPTADPTADNYLFKIEEGDAGDVPKDQPVPTSSWIGIEFDENVQFMDTTLVVEGGVTEIDTVWRDLNDLVFDAADIALTLKVMNETEGYELVYMQDYFIQKLVNTTCMDTQGETGTSNLDSDHFRIVIVEDKSHLGYGGSVFHPYSYLENGVYNWGSMKSNTEYSITLLPGRISDDPKDPEAYCVDGEIVDIVEGGICENRNIIDEEVLVTFFTTRDDTPPQLSIFDANGAWVCDSSCTAASELPFINGMSPSEGDSPWSWWNEWDSYLQLNGLQWPGQYPDRDTLCNPCVAQGPFIELRFDKPIVKTPTEILDWPNPNSDDYWQQVYSKIYFWHNQGVDWWTEANLYLDEDDLIDPENSRFLRIRQLMDSNGNTPTKNVWPEIEKVEISDDWTSYKLYFKEELESEAVYGLIFAPYTVKDQVRIPDGNEFLGLTCTFQVVDHIKPKLDEDVAFIYYDKGFNKKKPGDKIKGTSEPFQEPIPDGLPNDMQLAMVFDEPVIGGTGNVTIRWEHGQQEQIIPVDEVTFGYDLWMAEVLDPDNAGKDVEDLDYYDVINYVFLNNDVLTEYELFYVEVDPGFVTDLPKCLPYGKEPNKWDGIDPEADHDPFEWAFRTGDDTPPTPIAYYPDCTNSAQVDSRLIMVMDENVKIPEDANKGFYIYAGTADAGNFGNFVEFIPFNSPRIEILGTDIYNGLTADSIVVRPEMQFESNIHYVIRVSGGVIKDFADNTWGGVHDTTTCYDNSWEFRVTNDVAPILETVAVNDEVPMEPPYQTFAANDESTYVDCNVEADPHGYAIADLHMTFVDEDNEEPLMVAKGTGEIRIYEYIYDPVTFTYFEELLYPVIDINDESVVIQGNTVTVNNVHLRDEINLNNPEGPRFYYVNVTPGAITNGYEGSLTFWDGINDAFTWRFQTCADDSFMVGYTINYVADDAVNVDPVNDNCFSITYNEGIQALPEPTGMVQIFAEGVATPVDEIMVMDAHIDGSTLEFCTDALVDEMKYYVVIQPGAFGDTSTIATPYTGLMDTTAWNIETGDYTAPVPVLATALGDCEESDVTIEFTFDETFGVQPGPGSVRLWSDGVEVMAISGDSVVVDGSNSVMVTFAGLADTTEYTVSVDSAFVKDNGTNELANMAVMDIAMFMTGDNTAPVASGVGPAGNAEEAEVTVTISTNEGTTPVAGTLITVTADGQTPIVWDPTDLTQVDGQTYTGVASGLADTTEYTVTVGVGAFQDTACTPNATVEETVWTFTTDDNTAPMIDAVSPDENEILGTYLDILADGIQFCFNEKVTLGAGNITIASGHEQVIAVDSSAVTLSDDGMCVTVMADKLEFGEHTVTIDAGAFMDMAINPNGNEEYMYNFLIKDSIPPDMDCDDGGFTPVDGTCGVSATPDLVLTFCEIVMPGTGMLHVYEALETGTNELAFSTAITADMIDGHVVTVPVTTPLKDMTAHIVEIDAGAITDEAGNPYAGINDPTIWNFTTGDNTVPTATLEGDMKVMKEFTVNVIFSEPVANVDESTIVVEGADSYTVTVNEAGDMAMVDITAMDYGTEVTVSVTDAIMDIVDEDCQMANAVVPVMETYMVIQATIPEIQGMDDESPLTGSEVVTMGTVTGVSEGEGFFMQDANAAWSGIWVEYSETSGIQIGNGIMVTGDVAEVANVTTVVVASDVQYIMPPVVVEPIVLDNPADAEQEMYESVLVTVPGARATAADEGSGEWTIYYEELNNVVVNDWLYSYTPVEGDWYNVTGIVNARLDDYKLEPRMESDIVNITETAIDDIDAIQFKIYPNPFNDRIYIDNFDKLTRVVINNIVGQRVIDVEYPGREIRTANLVSGVYLVSLYTEEGIAKTERIVKR